MDDPLFVVGYDAESNQAFRVDGVCGLIIKLVDDLGDDTDDWSEAVSAVVEWPCSGYSAFALEWFEKVTIH